MTDSPQHEPSEHESIDQDRVAERADLLPEETAAGSDDPAAQARILLEDSDARTDDPARTKAESVQTPDRHE